MLIPIFLSQIVFISCWLGIEFIPITLVGILVGIIFGIALYIVYNEINMAIQDRFKIDVNGKCTLITGCDSGFGFRLAKSLSQRGMFVFAGVLNINSEGAENLKGLTCMKVIQMNVTKDEEVEEALEIVQKYLNDTNTVLWAVVNNAGICKCGILEFMSIDKFQQILNVNSLGMLRVCQKFAHLLRGHGRIVNVTSIAGLMTAPFVGGYCASKFAAEAITEILKMEMKYFDIDVIKIQPGGYKTNITDCLKRIYSINEERVYGEEYMKECQELLNKLSLSLSENVHEVVSVMESGILNKRFQSTYIPGFTTRLLISVVKLLSIIQNEQVKCYSNLPTKK